MSNIIIRKAASSDLPQLKEILDKATLKLLKKGVQQWEYPWDEKLISSFVEKEEFYIILADDTPRGCFGIKNYSDNPFCPEDSDGLYWYHLASHPDHDKGLTGQTACMWVQEYSKTAGRKVYFDCWSGNSSLINYYTFMGFTPLGVFPEEDYFVMAFST